jgi:DNA repair protein SbcC/Rad50
MATASDKKIVNTFDSTWESQDLGTRLRTLEKLDSSDSAIQQTLIRIAHNDEHIEVRCSAIMLLTDLNELKNLLNEKTPVKDSALQQSCRILAGTFDASLNQQQRLSQLKDLSGPAVKQIALISKCKATGSETVSMIEQAEDLADICLYASSVHVRKSAALKIEDTELLAEIREKVRGKDKTVFKVIDQRLSEPKKAVEEKTDIKEKATPKAGKNNSAAPTLEKGDEKSVPGNEKPAAPPLVKTPAKPPLDAKKELPALEQEFPKLSYKNTIRLYEFRSILNKLLSNTEKLETDLHDRAEKLKQLVADQLEKNIEYQEKTKQATEVLLESLKQALEDGSSERAMQFWDKIQGNISNTSNRVREILQKQTNIYKAKLIELRDWKTFAATEKKKELITQLEHLIGSKMQAGDRSKYISKMHKEWKSLGRSNHNESLWKKFKKLSDEAYEPCKEHFKQRKQLMADNFEQRRRICDALEAELKSLQEGNNQSTELVDNAINEQGESTQEDELQNELKEGSQQSSKDEENGKEKEKPEYKLDTTDINKLLNTAEKDWKHFAPIEQAKIKGLQKRFYAAINEFRKIRKNSLHVNANQKLLLIAQAQALTTLEDNKQAMNEAKRLQQEWKIIGQTSYKEDNKYWLEFRAACDKIFEKRNDASNEVRENLKQAEQDLAKILQSMESLFQFDDDSFRKSRNEYQDLAQKFSNALDPRLKQQRGRLLDQFNALKRRIDSRYKMLPDKKQQQLKKIVLEKADFLDRIELELLDTKDELQFLDVQKKIDQSAWENMESSGSAKFDSALKERINRVLKAQSLGSIRKLAQQNESDLRSLCIQTEIKANIETPAQDQAQRMQIQLQQLKSGFGQSKPETKDSAKHALEIELESYCLGPLEREARQELSLRLLNAIKKLL